MSFFGLFGPPNVEKLKAKNDLKGLIKALRYEKDATVRQAAAEVLGQIGDAQTVEPLIVSLRDKNWYVRLAATETLGRIGGDQALKSLVVMLNDPKPDVRKASSRALEKIGASAIEVLIAALKDVYTRQVAAEVLKKIGVPVVESLVAMFKNADREVHQIAAEVLGEIGDTRAVPPLITALKDKDWGMRQAAAKTLGQIGGAQAVESLIISLTDTSKSVRQTAAEALEKIGIPAIEPLVAILKDVDRRRAASDVLEKIGAPAVEPLIAALNDQDEDVRWTIVKLLGQIGAEVADSALSNKVVEILISAIEDEDNYVRRDAVKALGQISQRIEDDTLYNQVVGSLLISFEDSNQDVRQEATKILGQIGPQLEDAALREQVENRLEAALEREKPLQEDPVTPPSHEPSASTELTGPGKEKRFVQLEPQEIAWMERYDNDLSGLYEAAIGYLREGNYDSAFQAFSILTKIFPDESANWTACGIALYSKDEVVWNQQSSGKSPYANVERSLTYFKQALTLDRNDHFTWYSYGLALAQIGFITTNKKRLKESLDAFEEALRFDPADESTLQVKAQVEKEYLAMGGVLPSSKHAEQFVTERTRQFRNRARQRAKVWWEQQSGTLGKCDWCGEWVTKPEGYALESKDILRSKALEERLNVQYDIFKKLGRPVDNLKANRRAKIAADQTGWLICPTCIGHFFDEGQTDLEQFEQSETTTPLPEQKPSPLLDDRQAVISSPTQPNLSSPPIKKDIYTVGDVIEGHYEVVKTLAGGMGVVYLCLDQQTYEAIALKTFQPKYLANRAARDRFLREGKTWIDLGLHPHIVHAYEVQHIPTTNEVYLKLQWVAATEITDDPSLRRWLTPGRPLPLEQALLFTLHIVRGMKFATDKIPTLVHRDLKPENVLVGRDGQARVTDFGLAKVLQEQGDISVTTDEEQNGEMGLRRTQLTQGIVGTPLYMAPEQWEPQDIDQRADIYALGCILVEMLTGQMAVRARSRQACRQLHQSGQALKSAQDLPDVVMPLLRSCLAVDPNDRFNNWAEVETAIDQIYRNMAGESAPVVINAENEQATQIMAGWSYYAMAASYSDIGKFSQARTLYERIVNIGKANQKREFEMIGLIGLGGTCLHLGEVRQAIGFTEQALAIAREMKDRTGEVYGLYNLGLVHNALGEARQAIEFYEQALSIAQEIEDRNGQQAILNGLGDAYHALGEYQRAIKYFKQSLGIARMIGDRNKEGMALGNIGMVLINLGDVQQAIEFYEQVLTVSRETGDPYKEMVAIEGLGLAYRLLGDTQRAIESHEESLKIARDTGHREGEETALGSLGSVYFALGEAQQAIGYYEQALAIAREIGNRHSEGLLLNNLGASHANLGETTKALEYFQQAMVVAEEIGNKRDLASTSFNCGKLLAQLGWYIEALPYAKHAMQLYEQLEDKAALQEAQRIFNLLPEDTAAQNREDPESITMAKTIAQISAKTEAALGIKIEFVSLKGDTVKLRVGEVESGVNNYQIVLWRDLGVPERQFALELGAKVAFERLLGKSGIKVEFVRTVQQTGAVNLLNPFVAGCGINIAEKLEKLLSS